MMKNICFGLGLIFCYATLGAQDFEKQTFFSIDYSSLQFSSDESYSYTFHQFDPAIFLNDAHEHFNVNSLESSKETFQTISLRYQHALNDQLWFAAELPYAFYQRNSNADFYKRENSGFGDFLLEGNYVWYNSLLTTGTEKWEAYLGAAIEFGTGKYDYFDDEGELEPILLPGSGSTDLIFSNTFLLRQNRMQYFLKTSYRRNAKNKFGYKFGDQLSNQVKVHYPFNEYQDLKLALNLDASFHLLEANEMNNRELFDEAERGRDSGGQWLNAGLEFQAHLHQFVLSGKYTLPVYQQLDGQQPKIDGAFFASLKYLL